MCPVVQECPHDTALKEVQHLCLAARLVFIAEVVLQINKQCRILPTSVLMFYLVFRVFAKTYAEVRFYFDYVLLFTA